MKRIFWFGEFPTSYHAINPKFLPFFNTDLQIPTNPQPRIYIAVEKHYRVFAAITNLRLYVTHNISTCMNQ